MGHCVSHRFILILVMVLIFTLSAGCLKESSLTVSDITVSPGAVTGSLITLNVTVAIANSFGYPEGPATVQLQVIQSETGMEIARQSVLIGTIGKGESIQAEQQVTIPKQGSCRIAVTVFEGRKEKAVGEILISNLDTIPSDEEKSGFRITDTVFSVTGVSDGKAQILCYVYLTNAGNTPSPACDLQVRTREEEANLMVDNEWTSLEEVKPGCTVIKAVNLTVPDQYNYITDIMVWKNQTVILRGTSKIRLRPGETNGDNSGYSPVTIETSKFVRVTGEEKLLPAPVQAMKTPGPGIILCTTATGLAFFAWRRRK